MEPMEILKHFDTSFVSEKAIITQLKHEEDDELYQNALFCYMVCTLEKQTLKGWENVK